MTKGSFIADMVAIIGTQDLVFVKLIVSFFFLIAIIFWFKIEKKLKFVLK